MRPAGRPKASRNGWGDSSMLDAGTRQCPGMRAHRHTGRGVPIRSPSISQDICLPLININNHTGDDLSCCVFCCSETHKSHKTANKTHTPRLDESTRQHVSCGRTPSFFMFWQLVQSGKITTPRREHQSTSQHGSTLRRPQRKTACQKLMNLVRGI